jgi:DNA-binding NtrC family response regulator
MNKQLKVMLVEDSEDDALLVLRELRKGGYDPVSERIETPEAMKVALQKQKWDIIISDYFMPGFSGPAALRLLKESGFDLPFIIVSGKIGEDTAVEVMKAGAHDYILKENMTRLAPAIKRELIDAETRHARRKADEALKKAYEELEAKVIERTAELRLSNASLKQEIAHSKAVEKEKEKLIEELKEALANVKTLSGLLPICAWCKKIRDDKGYWNKIESYISEHSDALFTHGMCPECFKKNCEELEK